MFTLGLVILLVFGLITWNSYLHLRVEWGTSPRVALSSAAGFAVLTLVASAGIMGGLLWFSAYAMANS